MSIAQILIQFWSRFLASAAYEDDPGFHDTILRLCRRGMVAFGVFGVVGTLAYLGAYAATGAKIALHYGIPAPSIVLWDKLVVLTLSVGYLALAPTRLGPRWGRLIGAVFVLAVCIAWMLDDAARGDMAFSGRYLSIVVLVAVATIPYKPWQAFSFAAFISGMYFLGSRYLPVLFGAETGVLIPGQFVYLILVIFLCTGISAVLYEGRYRGYLAQRRTERLLGQVAEQADQLQVVERLKARFFANVSHEFRTPLTLIIGPLQDIIEGAYEDDPPRLHEQHRLMLHSAQRLLYLINQLLDLTRLEAGKMELRPQPGDLTAFVRDLTRSFIPLAERKRLTLKFQSELGALPFLFDPDVLEKIVSNLISNALKFTPEGGKVWVTMDLSGGDAADHVSVAVKDTGPGISRADLTRIFDRFQQVDTSATRAQGGTGIGLALAKELVELHGGEMGVESEPGFGSTFTVRLPRVVPARVETPAEATPDDGDAAAFKEMAIAGSKRPVEAERLPDEPIERRRRRLPKLLIVEDNADVRAYLKSHLEADYLVVEAEDGEAGLAAARAEQPALVLADVMMPRMDGYEMCRLLKADARLRHVPVVMLTARAGEEATLEGLACGADDYVAKPFSMSELKARLANLIATRREMRSQFSREIVVQPAGVTIQPEEEVFLERVLAMIEAHLGDGNFSVDWLADEVGLSRRQLERKLEAIATETPAGLIRRMRLERAAQLLRAHAGTIAEIAYRVGFKSPAHFSKAFREAFGVSPSKHIEKAS